MHKGDNSCFVEFPYLQSNTDLFKAEYPEHTMISEICSKIPLLERGVLRVSQCPLRQIHSLNKENLSLLALSRSGIRTLAGPNNLIPEADVLQTYPAGRGSVLA